ncbi:MAG: hypothetical protein FJX71_03110 [Alphaproteobacteria bacterium]|nr:hypothetical protein [Alphaproteobacteria bacterium]
MWTRSHSKVFKSVEKKAIWDRWSDVNNWHEWVPNVEFCRLDKPFATGSQFILKPKGAPAITVQLVEVERDQKFTGCTRFFGATMYDTHEMKKDPEGGVRLTVTLRVTGPLGFIWRKLVAEKIEANLPRLMRDLTDLASSSPIEFSKPGALVNKSSSLLLKSISTGKKSAPKPKKKSSIFSKGKSKVKKAAFSSKRNASAFGKSVVGTKKSTLSSTKNASALGKSSVGSKKNTLASTRNASTAGKGSSTSKKNVTAKKTKVTKKGKSKTKSYR